MAGRWCYMLINYDPKFDNAYPYCESYYGAFLLSPPTRTDWDNLMTYLDR